MKGETWSEKRKKELAHERNIRILNTLELWLKVIITLVLVFIAGAQCGMVKEQERWRGQTSVTE